MPSLPDLQRVFASALQHADPTLVTTAVFRDPPERALGRLAIYRGNVHANSTKALATAYPVVRKIVGEPFFEAMAREYARARPSRSGDLSRHGEHLPDFLETFPHTAELPYLPDVARMEWLVHRAHFAEDAPRFDASSVARLPPESFPDLRPQLVASCALLESAWPLGYLWTIHQDDYAGAFEIDLHAGPDRVLVHRPLWLAQVTSIPPGDFRFLSSAARGETLGAALEAGAADAAFDPSTALAHWIDAQIIASLV